PPPPPLASAPAPEPEDPLQPELERQRQELRQTQERLLAEMQRLHQVQAGNEQADRQAALLSKQFEELAKERGTVENAVKQQGASVAIAQHSLEELRQRRERLEQDLRTLEKMPSPKQTLRYHTPVSRPVRLEELHFECQGGRVAFVDVAAFLAEVRDGMREKADTLRQQWQVESVTAPVGPFRMRYTIARERGALDGPGGLPDTRTDFRYGLDGWVIEPLAGERGETVEQALAPNSTFRQTVDGIDPEQAVVTFWVSIDSFPLFRRLRDYLYERNVEVAGRPLPPGYPIASSRHGSVSRGQ
ncbi:MAG TPA: hypothetical protein VEL76_30695, partial [Gemmataceae bacterium]|nr:hypothetical protein [Gemmataceae bacterium]